jgi:hypothetical protein
MSFFNNDYRHEEIAKYKPYINQIGESTDEHDPHVRFNKNFKTAIINMFKELKETIIKGRYYGNA